MRKTKILLFLCLLAAQVSAQTPEETYFRHAGDHAALYQGLIEPPFPYAQWKAHPYLDDTEFHNGDVCFRGIVYHDVGLRLDILNGRLVVRTPERGIAMVPESEDIEWFAWNGQRYVPCRGSFARVEYDGNNVSLLMLREKVRTRDVEEGRHSYGNLKVVDHLIVTAADGRNAEVSKLKQLRALFPEYKAQLTALSSARHLKWNNADARLAALKVCTEWLDENENGNGNGNANVNVRDNHAVTGPVVPVNVPVSVQTYRNYDVVPISVNINVDFADTILPVWDAYKGTKKVMEQDLEYFEEDDATGVGSFEAMREYVIEEVEVLAATPKTQTLHPGMEKFRPSALRNIPLAMGEGDVLKLVQTMPGVTSMGEASSGFNVRGGADDQNLLLIGSNTLFNPMHLFGLFSALDPDGIGETELYKGGIPARYGGRLSSVMAITPHVADKQKFRGSASIGLLTGKGSLEVPIVKEKASLLVSARTTYSDWLLHLLPDDSGYNDGQAGFYDMSALLDVTPDERNRITVNAYHSHDRFALTSYNRYAYTNTNAAAEWRMRPTFNEMFRFTFGAGYDHYDYSNDDLTTDVGAARLTFAIDQVFAKALVEGPLSDSHSLQAGIDSRLSSLNPGTYAPLGEASTISLHRLPDEGSVEASVFAEDRWNVSPDFDLTAGARYTFFRALTAGKEQTYSAPELRVAAGYTLNDNLSLKAGFNNTHQFIQKVSNTVIMSPTDTWLLANALVRPERGWQASAGLFWLSDDSRYELSLEGYAKRINGCLTYRGGAVLTMNPHIEEDVIPAEGHAEGIELQLRKHTGKLTGWVSYCYSRTLLRQQVEKDLSGSGDWFPADYDRPHQVKFVSNYQFTHRYSLSLNADYSTGRPVTVPAGKFYSVAQQSLVPYYTRHNGYRLPDYFRMDASFNIEPGHRLTKLTHGWFSVGVYNITGRRNAYSVWYEADRFGIHGYQLSIFGCPIPYASYNIRF